MAWRQWFSDLSNCTLDSPCQGNLVKTLIAGPSLKVSDLVALESNQVFSFLTGFQMMMILLVQGPNFENYQNRKYPETWYSFIIFFCRIVSEYFLNWKIIALQFCKSIQQHESVIFIFICMHIYTYVYLYLYISPPSTLFCHSRLSRSARLGALCYIATSHQLLYT